MIRSPPRSTRPAPLLPSTTLFRSIGQAGPRRLPLGAVDEGRPAFWFGQPFQHVSLSALSPAGTMGFVTTTPRVRAPELRGRGWLNTAGPLTLRELRGRFVLLDFWTFCCINCLHVLDELRPVEEEFADRSEEHSSELQSLMRISYAVYCLKKK